MLLKNAYVTLEIYNRNELERGEYEDIIAYIVKCKVRWDENVNKYETRFHKSNPGDMNLKLASLSTDNKRVSKAVLDNRKLVQIIKHEKCSNDVKLYRIVDVADYSLLNGIECLVIEGSYQEE